MCKAREDVVLGIDGQHSKEAKFRTQSSCGEQEGHVGEGMLAFLGERPVSLWRESLNCRMEEQFVSSVVYPKEE